MPITAKSFFPTSPTKAPTSTCSSTTTNRTTPPSSSDSRGIPAREYEQVSEREGFDLNLYQMGNSSYHRYVLNAALRFPGVVVLHDLVLQHLFLGLSVERGDAALYVSEMKRAYGERGGALGRQICRRTSGATSSLRNSRCANG